MRKTSDESGSILVSILIIMIFLTMTVLSLAVISQANITRSTQRIYLLQAQYAAESGADAVVAYINSGSATYPDNATEKTLFTYTPTYRATYTATVTDTADPNKKKVISVGKVYQPSTATTPKITYKVGVDLERSSKAFTSSIVSRNSVEVASSVKEVRATSLFVNEYVRANKNTNDLVIDELIIAGKYPDASNCSLSGTGNLVRSPALVASGTKAILKMAYNNCMDVPPGNTSNADFDITANDTTLEKVASIYIPWNFKMNNLDAGGEYTNGSCSDFTAASPVIPSAGNARKTHYPDSGSGVTTAALCGGSGGAPADISLGTKTITLNDHMHIRANLCKATSCSPTFINPDASKPKFVFVEGVINFENVIVTSASSPGDVVFVSYSTSQILADSKQCPSNSAAIRLGKAAAGLEISAPKAYFIATNGMLCVDQTKFNATVASLGGISGKDIYLSSNSGAVFTLTFNPDFPLSAIPLDLSWRASTLTRVY